MGALAGLRILVTRAAESSEGLAKLLRERGATVLLAPAVELVPEADAAAVDHAIASLDARAYAWLAFTSRTSVVRFDEELRERGRDLRTLARDVKIAVVGPGTAQAVEQANLEVALVAAEHHGEGLAETLLGEMKTGEVLLLPRAKVAREVLPERLRAAGITVDIVVVYRTKKPSADSFAEMTRALREGQVDAVTLTSSSTASHLVELLGADARALLARTVLASIGPVTTATAEGLGLLVPVTANPHTLEGLTTALEAYFQGRNGTSAHKLQGPSD